MAEWSNLPIDVLEHLTSFLSLPDYHRFSVVCQNWWTAAKPRRHSPAKQLPWLLARDDSDRDKYRVFNVSENRKYNTDFPELQGQHVCGSSYGWLFTMDIDLNFRLLNPLTGKHYDLPPLPPLSRGDSVIRYVKEATGDSNEMTYEAAQFQLVDKVIIDHDPCQRSDFTVLILYGMFQRIAFWRPGNLVWTLVVDNYLLFDDITFFKGNFYTSAIVDVAGVDTCVTFLVNVRSDPKSIILIAPQVPMCNDSRTYLVDFRGELLLLQKYHPELIKDHRPHPLRSAFLVYKLDLEEGKYHRRHHLDGYSIFLGYSSPLVVDCSQFPGCRENSIYFTAYVDCNEEDDGQDDMFKGTVPAYCPPEIYETFSPNVDIADPIWWIPNPW